jgi:Xaa-Pro aminopeptidase
MENNIIQQRLKKFRENLLENQIQAALITKRENYLYLSGFTGSSAYLIITQEAAILVTDFRYEEQANRQASCFEIVKFQGNIYKALDDLIIDRNISKLGFEEAYLTYNNYLEYKSKLSVKEFIPLNSIVDKMRFIKDTEEIELIKKAVEIADNGFTHIVKFIKPGVAEIEIAAELEYYMRKIGAKGASFETIVASGVRSSMPHGVASEKKINMGDTITLDFGAIFMDYCSDMTRTVFLGEPNLEMKKIYNLVLEAQLQAIAEAKVGLTGKEIDWVARNIINNAGFDKNFGHGLGHGVGLEIHEEPRLSPTGNIKMENGMVVTVEPGVYIPDFGGVRIEDIIIIDGDKPIVLTNSTKELVII